MFDRLKGKPLAEQVELLTRELVAIKSYNHTKGEAEKAEHIYNIIKSYPYFQKHPEHVWLQEIPDDPLGRKNVFARLEGKTAKTVLFHAHYDTVGTEDFGSLQSIAHDPIALLEYFKNYEAEERVHKDACSDEWMFGRGALDMQSGIAVHLTNMLYFSEKLDSLEGNMVFLFNADEESGHAGIMAALSEIKRLKEEADYSYIAAINNDFISPIYDGDNKRYIYTGAAGKLLPSFYIYGKEAHVGDVLTSIDPTVIASKINVRVNQSLDLLEEIPSEFTLPPSCLYFKEQKKSYNVQTPLTTRLYFNYFIYEKTAQDVLAEMKEVAEQVVTELEETSRKRFEQYRQLHQYPVREVYWNVEVVTLEEYLLWLEGQEIPYMEIIQTTWNEFKEEDPREVAFRIVEALQLLDPSRKPRVLVFFAPPYLPHNYIQEHDQVGKRIKDTLEKCLQEVSKSTGEVFEIKKFFPYLADGSFLSLHDDDKEIDSFKKNLPYLEKLYPIPIENIRSLNIPSINIGVYGKDGHQWTERVYKPYSFSTLPSIIQKVALELFKIDS